MTLQAHQTCKLVVCKKLGMSHHHKHMIPLVNVKLFMSSIVINYVTGWPMTYPQISKLNGDPRLIASSQWQATRIK